MNDDRDHTIVGFARRDGSDDPFRDHLGSGVKKYGSGFEATCEAAAPQG